LSWSRSSLLSEINRWYMYIIRSAESGIQFILSGSQSPEDCISLSKYSEISLQILGVQS
jgi:hypothetical protein